MVEMPAGKDRFDGDEIEVYYDDTTTARATGLHTADDEAEPALDNGAVEESRQADCTGGQPAADMPTLLLVEDNMDLCRMMRLQLKQRYNVVVANDGTQGLERIYRYHPDIIVTDLMMPGIDGLQLLRKVRQDFAISHTPVIVLTAKNSEEDRMKATGSGANAFISKPFSSAYLVARIDQLLDEQRIFQRKMILQNNAESSANATQDEYEQHLVKKDLEFMRKIQEIVDKNLNANDFNIDLIAEQMGLSRSAFFKKLKSLSGFAPVDYVKEIRLSKAARLIETTDSSITEIAYSVGFRDAGYFGKCFRKKYGMTPKEYRRKG